MIRQFITIASLLAAASAVASEVRGYDFTFRTPENVAFELTAGVLHTFTWQDKDATLILSPRLRPQDLPRAESREQQFHDLVENEKQGQQARLTNTLLYYVITETSTSAVHFGHFVGVQIDYVAATTISNSTDTKYVLYVLDAGDAFWIGFLTDANAEIEDDVQSILKNADKIANKGVELMGDPPGGSPNAHP
jgi:hypothetical protein